MESMTGFGSTTEVVGGYEVTILCRSVNNKGLTVSFRIPRQTAHLEQALGRAARELFSRGRIDVNISLEAKEGASLPEPDLDLARAYIRASEKLSGEFYLTSSPDSFSLVTLPGVMRQPEPEEGEGFDESLLSACNDAFAALLANRREEGNALEEHFRDSLGKIAELSVPVSRGQSERVKGVFLERRKRVEELLREPFNDENRLAQELALLSDRMDISEEFQRLSTHIESALGILSGNQCGRKLGFILQEMHRELNTMGAKVDDSEAVRTVIEMKDLLGGLREQVANVQ
jgi:uncharacterized protein (TIGR00255 family)